MGRCKGGAQHIYVTEPGLTTHYKCSRCAFLRPLKADKVLWLETGIKQKRPPKGSVERRTFDREAVEAVKQLQNARIGNKTAECLQIDGSLVVPAPVCTGHATRPVSARQQFGGNGVNTCAYCLCDKVLSLDHMRPTSQGGTNTVGNTLYACCACNTQKRDRTVEEWASQMDASDPRQTILAALLERRHVV